MLYNFKAYRLFILYIITGQINVNKRDLKALLAIAEHFSMTNLVTELKKILLSSKFPKSSI